MTPYEKRFKPGQILKVVNPDGWFDEGDLVMLTHADQGECPHFRALNRDHEGFTYLYRLEPATYQEIKAVKPDYELKVGDTVKVVVRESWRSWVTDLNEYHGTLAVVTRIDNDGDYKIEQADDWYFEGAALMSEQTQTEEETQTVTKQTPFQAAGYTADTVFLTPDGVRVRLNEDDGSEAPYFERVETGHYFGVFGLDELTVEVADEPEKVAAEGAIEDNSLEGLIVLVRGARSELARVEALLAAKTEELRITVVIDEVAQSVEQGLLLTTAQEMFANLREGDQFKIEVKQGHENLSDWDLADVHTVYEVDYSDTYRPIRTTQESRQGAVWVRPETYNIRKLS